MSGKNDTGSSPGGPEDGAPEDSLPASEDGPDDRAAPSKPAGLGGGALDARAPGPDEDAKAVKASPPEAPTGVLDYLRTRHDPLTSLVLTIPVFLLYHLGILAIDLRNGADLISSVTMLLVRDTRVYVGVTLGFTAALGVAAWLLRKRGRLRPARLPWVLTESLVLALVMMFTVGWLAAKVPVQTGPAPGGFFTRLVMAAGAGFHEELVFRVGLFAGGAWILDKRVPKLGAFGAALVAALVSSLLFSLAHYLGSLGDVFTLQSFAFRLLAGLFLCAVYRWRGFAVAVWTHFLYDVFIFFFVD